MLLYRCLIVLNFTKFTFFTVFLSFSFFSKNACCLGIDKFISLELRLHFQIEIAYELGEIIGIGMSLIFDDEIGFLEGGI